MSEKIDFRIRVNEPIISRGAYDVLCRVLDSGYLSPGGEWVGRLEKRWAAVCGTKFAVACSSGTAAIHLALLASNIGPGDEVIVPALTCPDTLNAVLFSGAKPVIVDVELSRYGMSAFALYEAITPKTAAVIPVHLYGAPVEEGVFSVAEENDLFIIEDAAEAHGATYGDIKVGARGNVGCFSFRGDKIVGCGTGGIITTNSWRIAERAQRRIGLASIGDGLLRYNSREIGYSFEMSNIMAAFAHEQIGVLDETIAGKRRMAVQYDALLEHPQIRRPKIINGHVFWKYMPMFMDVDLERVFQAFAAERIEVAPSFVPMYRLPMYEDPSGGDWATFFPNSEFLFKRLLGLPSGPSLRLAQINEISQLTIKIIEEYGI